MKKISIALLLLFTLAIFFPSQALSVTADFTFTPESAKTDVEIDFTDQSTADSPITDWHWEFGDGSDNFTQNPNHTYTSPDTYTITLLVEDDAGDTDIATDTIYIESQKPDADFTFEKNYPITNEKVNFTDQSTAIDGKIVEWSWDFDDGNTSNNQNPSNIYSSGNSYDVVLTVTNDFEKSDSVVKTVNVKSSRIDLYVGKNNDTTTLMTSDAGFQWSEQLFDTGSIRFFESSPWGDIFVATDTSSVYKINSEKDTELIFKAPDTVRDMDVNRKGDIYHSQVTYIRFSRNHGSVVRRNNKGEVVWRDNLNSPVHALGADSADHVYVASQIHNYRDPDTTYVRKYDRDGDIIWSLRDYEQYSAEKLEVDNDGNVVLASGSNKIYKISKNKDILWDYTKPDNQIKTLTIDSNNNIYAGTRGGTLYKVDSSGNHLWSMNTPDGSEFLSATIDKNDSIYYSTTGRGLFKINPSGDTLWIDNLSSSAVALANVYRDGTDNYDPVADFTYNPKSPQKSVIRSFESLSSDNGEIISHEWDFDDGTIRDSENTKHSFLSPGTYNVQLTVKDDENRQDSVTRTVNVDEFKESIMTVSEDNKFIRTNSDSSEAFQKSFPESVKSVDSNKHRDVALIAGDTVYRLDSTNKTKFSKSDSGSVVQIDEDRDLYIATVNGRVKRYSEYGRLLWSRNVTSNSITDMSLSDSYIYTTQGNDEVRKVSKRNGSLDNVFTQGELINSVEVKGNRVYFGGRTTDQGFMKVVSDRTENKILQRTGFSAPITEIGLSESGVYLGTGIGFFGQTPRTIKLDQNGSSMWEYIAHSDTVTGITYSNFDKHLYLASGNSVHKITEKATTKWEKEVHNNTINEITTVEANFEKPDFDAKSVDEGKILRIETGDSSETVAFNNKTISYDTYSWNFGDATEQIADNPVHVYDDVNLYRVNLKGYVNGRETTNTIKEVSIKSDQIITQDDVIYSAGFDSRLVKLDQDGNKIWEFTEPQSGIRDIGIDRNENIYIVTDGQTLYKLTPSKQVLWTYNGHKNSIRNVEIDDNLNVYTASADGTLHKVSPNGIKIWEYTGHSGAILDVELDQNGNKPSYIYTASDDGTIHKLSFDGSKIWEFTNHTGTVRTIALDGEGNIYSGGQDDSVRKISPSGSQIWKRTTLHRNRVLKVQYSNGYVYSGAADLKVNKIDAEDGSKEWTYQGHTNSIYDIAMGDDNKMYTGSADQEVHKLDRTTGDTIWEAKNHEDWVLTVEALQDGDIGFVHKPDTKTYPKGNFTEDVDFIKTTTDFSSYIWYFGDQDFSQEFNPTHEYEERLGGEFDVELEAYRRGKFLGEITKTIQIDDLYREEWIYPDYNKPIVDIVSSSESKDVYGITGDKLKRVDGQFSEEKWNVNDSNLKLLDLSNDNENVLYSDGNEILNYNKNGSVSWSYSGSTSDITDIDFSENGSRVYLSSSDQGVVGLIRSDGQKDFEYSGNFFDIEPGSNSLYATSNDQTVRKYDVVNNSEEWNTNLNCVPNKSIKTSQGLIVGTESCGLYSIDKASGSVNWNEGSEKVGVFDADSDVIVTGSNQGELKVYDSSTGNQIWTDTKFESEITDIDISDSNSNIVFVSDQEGFLYKIDKSTGQVEWKYDDRENARPAINSISEGIKDCGCINIGLENGQIRQVRYDNGDLRMRFVLTFDFTPDTPVINVGQTEEKADFTNDSFLYDRYEWDFDDGDTDVTVGGSVGTSNKYTEPKHYDVKLKGIFDGEVEDVLEKTIHVLFQPRADFNWKIIN